MRKLRIHRTTALILVLVLATAALVSGISSSVSEDNEERLLRQQADQVGLLVDSLATQAEAPAQAAATLAALDPTGVLFATAAPRLADQVWATARRDGDSVTVDQVINGDPALLGLNTGELDAGATERLMAAFDNGEFVVVGILGGGFSRRLAYAAGPPGGGDVVVYTELSLIEGVSSPSTGEGSDDILEGLDFALYVGADPSEESLVLATTGDLPLAGNHLQRTMTIGEMPITFDIKPKGALSGTLAERAPWFFALLVLGFGFLVVLVIEANMRKRDRAVVLVGELDTALKARDAADASRAEVEIELRQAQRLEAVGQLAGGVAHDFNNLLAAIMSYSDLLADDLADHPSRADVEEIRNAARRGAALTRQLLQFSRREAEEPQPLDVNTVIADLERLLAGTIGEEIELVTDLNGDLPSVRLDVSELEQVLMNLVVNARDAIDGPGTITVRTEPIVIDPDQVGMLGAVEAGLHVRLLVSDDGSGMSEDTIARAFEPFFTTKDRARGTGLGLATVYGIVQRAQGHIGIDSEPGVGTTFEVLLPADGAPVVPGTAMASSTRSHTGGQVVLYVEDEDAVRKAASRMLRRWGYEVIEARNGVEALALPNDTPIDLLLTDVIMPGGLNGRDVANRLREVRPGLPVLYVSGYSADVLSRRGVDGSEDAVVVGKPFTEDELRDAVTTALRAPSSVR